MLWLEIILSRIGLRCAELGLRRPAWAFYLAAARFEQWQLRDELPPDLSDLSRRLPAIHEALDRTVPLLEDPWPQPEDEPDMDLRPYVAATIAMVGGLLAAWWHW